MAEVIKLVQSDNLPEITLTLTDTNTGAALDLSDPNTVVVVYFRAMGSSTVASTLTCIKTNGGADGVVKFYFPGTTLNVDAGPYEAEIEISFNGQKHTVYDLLKFKVREDF